MTKFAPNPLVVPFNDPVFRMWFLVRYFSMNNFQGMYDLWKHGHLQLKVLSLMRVLLFLSLSLLAFWVYPLYYRKVYSFLLSM